MIGLLNLFSLVVTFMRQDQLELNRFKIIADRARLELDPIAVEEPLQISLLQSGTSEVFSLTMRTPGHDRELATGLLFSEGVINSAHDIAGFSYELVNGEPALNQLNVELAPSLVPPRPLQNQRHPSYSGCGLCGKTNLQALELKQSREPKKVVARFSCELIRRLRQLLARQQLFSSTGGVHAAGLVYQHGAALDDAVLDLQHSPFFEDVGRHNALDKLIGFELSQNDLQQAGVLLLSGRIGFELVQKAVMAGFSVIVALGAPSDLAIRAANQFGVALIGFAKDDRFNLYTPHSELLVNAKATGRDL